MKRELAIEFSRVTEAAALAAYKYLGRGDKNIADQAAVEAMRYMLNTLDIEGEIVIGEGEIDEAPMLYIGEKLGKGGDAVDIAVDPIEGTRMVAMGQANALATIAVAEKDGFLKAPDMYMEKLIVGPKARGVIDLNLPIEQNILAVAEALGKDVSDITVITLSKPRHDMMIKSVQDMGAKVFAIPDGDVAASILTCMPLSDVDMLYGIGGAPEGVVSAAVVRALGGDMNGRLLIRTDVKGDTSENQILAKMEMKRCKQMEVEINRVYKLDELAKTDNVIFSATGITKGDLLEGVRKEGVFAETETLLIRGKSRTVRKIHSTHYLERKDQVIKELVL
jgi:fructose-1,6-bisphosphatase II